MNRQRRDRNQGRRSPDDRHGQPGGQMLYPLPGKAAAAWRVYRGQRPQNPGLIFDRFAPDWGKQERVMWNGRQITAKEAGLRQVSEAALKADEALLRAWNARWQRMVAAAAAQPFSLWTDWRLVAGLGRDSAYEVGFTFHRYGFPILPGSSLKGLARAAGLIALAEKLAEVDLTKLDNLLSLPQKFSEQCAASYRSVNSEVRDLAENFRTIFGTTAAAGKAVFFDAIPAQPPRLELDIMNPHYPQYYQGSEPPADWQSPIPVYFLTVAPGTEFRFAVGWRGQREGEWKRLQRLASDWLTAGLMKLGAGGKTSAGYGYFTDRRPTQHVQAPAVTQAQRQPESPGAMAHPEQRGQAPAVTQAQRQPTPPSPSPEPEEAETWRTGTVIAFQSQLGRGEIIDDETGERLRIARAMFVSRAWTPGKNQKVEYTVAKQDGRSVVVRVRRPGQ